MNDGRISITRAADLIARSKGRYFGVSFVKKDGSFRNMVCRVGVRKGITGAGLKFDPNVRNLRVVNETVVERGADKLCRTTSTQFRMIPLDARLLEIRIGGKTYGVSPIL